MMAIFVDMCDLDQCTNLVIHLSFYEWLCRSSPYTYAFYGSLELMTTHMDQWPVLIVLQW